MKTPQAEEHNAQWEIKTHGLKKIDRKNEITKHVMKGGEQKKVYILFKKKRTPNPCFHFHDLST